MATKSAKKEVFMTKKKTVFSFKKKTVHIQKKVHFQQSLYIPIRRLIRTKACCKKCLVFTIFTHSVTRMYRTVADLKNSQI